MKFGEIETDEAYYFVSEIETVEQFKYVLRHRLPVTVTLIGTWLCEDGTPEKPIHDDVNVLIADEDYVIFTREDAFLGVPMRDRGKKWKAFAYSGCANQMQDFLRKGQLDTAKTNF